MPIMTPMIDLKDLAFLNALAKHRHFAKAAASCRVSQPAFSMRIRGMEDKLGVAIVLRGNRFQGLTPEGEQILSRARTILDQVRALEEDVLAAKGAVSGTLVLGVVPTAAAFAASLALRLRGAYPGVLTRINTASSAEIQQGIEEGSFDAALTYSDAGIGDLMEVMPLYREHYLFLAPAELAPTGETITWAEAAQRPIALLEPKMHNRRIIDAVFQDIGAEPDVIAEASALTICVSMVCEGLAATVVPEVLLASLGELSGTVALPLVEPELTKEIALVTPTRGHGLPTVEALKDVANMQ